MAFKIPFTVKSVKQLKYSARRFISKKPSKYESSLGNYLQHLDVDLTPEEYRGICLWNAVKILPVYYVIFGLIFFILGLDRFYVTALIVALFFSVFLFTTQMAYPGIFYSRRQKDIDKNLIPALQDMLVQLNSGIPLFNILANISFSGYGALSEEFGRAAKKINAGIPQIKVIEDLSETNASPYFRRTLWQISNGMRAGSDISIIIRESIKNLNEEQIIQIQTYGHKLNPLVMFYMLVSVVLPALSITFLTVIATFLGLPRTQVLIAFGILFIFVAFMQIMFIGVIKSLRPSLL